MMSISDFVHTYGPVLALEEYRKYREIFSIRRQRHNSYRAYNHWIDADGFLREAYAIPLIFEWNLKEGYYFPEMIH